MAHFGMKSVWNYEKNTVVNHAALHYGGKAFGDTARAFLHTDIAAKFNDFKDFDSAAMLNQWWIVDGDVSAGLRWEHCLKENNLMNPKALRIEGQYNLSKTEAVWAHFAFVNKFAALAYDWTWRQAGVDWRTTAMLTCCLQKAKSGEGDSAVENYQQFMNSPFGFRFGWDAQISKQMKVIANWGWSSRYFFNIVMNTEFKKNFTVGLHFHYDHDKRSSGPINLGFDVHYKCDDLLDITS